MRKRLVSEQKLKWILQACLLAVLLCIFIPASHALAQVDSSDPDCAKLEQQINSLDQFSKENPLKGLPGYCSVNSLSYKIITIFFYVAGGIAVIFIMIGGFQYMIGMSAGGDEAIGKAKKTITYSVIGLVIIVLAGTIVLIIYNLITGNSSGGATGSNSGSSSGSGSGSTIFNQGPGSGSDSGSGSGLATGAAGTGTGSGTTTGGGTQLGGFGAAPTFTISPDTARAPGLNYYVVKVSTTQDNLVTFCGGSVPALAASLLYNGVNQDDAGFQGDGVNSSATFNSLPFSNQSLVSVTVCGKPIRKQ